MKLKNTTQTSLKGLRLHLAYAITAYCEHERSLKGDNFCTMEELAQIQNTPLEYVDMLKGTDALSIVKRMLEA